MAEIRFPRARRHARRDAEPTTPTDPLAEMATQIRELDAAAERASTLIGEAATNLREGQTAYGSATRADLLAGLGAALVDRTEEIRSDCARLSALMERTARLIAEGDATSPDSPVDPGAPPAEAEPERDQATEADPAPELATELVSIISQPAAPEPTASQQPPKPRWLTRSDPPAESSAGVSEGVRLIATQMAIAGSSRAEIERRLRIQFGVGDADQALDEIFGDSRSGVG